MAESKMPAQLAELAGRQDGIITRQQALAAGLSQHALTHRLGRQWQRVLPGIYATTTGELATAQQWRAALLYGGESAMLGGPTAAAAYGLRTLPRISRIHVLLRHQVYRPSTGFVVVRRTRFAPDPWIVGDLWFVPAARAVVDSCRELRSLDEVRAVLADALQRQVVSLADVATEVARGEVAGNRRVRRVLAEVADGVRSAAEGQAYQLIASSGLPMPCWNRDLFSSDGQWLARPDAWWRDCGVVLEIDSRAWHLLPAHWQATMERHQRMTACGLLVVHVSPRQIADDPQGFLRNLAHTLEAGARRASRPIVTDEPPSSWASRS